MSDRVHQSGKNSPYRRGTVIERDPQKGRVKIRFDDEDEDTSGWIHVLQGGTGANKLYRMPDMDSQVVCLMDWDGEDGAVLGAIWSSADGPPTGDGELFYMAFAGGLMVVINQGSNDISVTGANNVDVKANTFTLEAASITLKGPVAIEGASLTHNGKNVGDTHGHVSAPSGPPGPPV
ncbi:hypothetical protein J7481_19490 [Labrenzia sp. R4_2]|uniref:phage baseplate assembly protein V n=1 Tax=Labrenzia sp. R4_2 TaxID=2821107 RepID=UPI001ADD1790|nr:hypothetical protein [Labrenzia sp. R4_2]